MPPLVAQKCDHQIGGAVDDLRLVLEIGGGVDEAHKLDHPLKARKIAATGGVHLCEEGQGAGLGRSGAIFDADRIAVGGDSAGGNLTATLMHDLGERKLPLPKAQVMIYAGVDPSLDTQSMRDLRDAYIIAYSGVIRPGIPGHPATPILTLFKRLRGDL